MSAFQRTNYSGYVLDRDELLSGLAAQGITPRHERLFAEHITYAYPDVNCAPTAHTIRIVGYAADDLVDCVKVEVTYSEDDRDDNRDDKSMRPDGKVFHCTLSVARNGKPVMSNQLLAGSNVRDITPFDVTHQPF